MGYRNLRTASPTSNAPASSSASRRRSIPTWKWPRSSGASTQAGGPALLLRRRQGLRLSDGRQPVRHPRAHPLPVPRYPRRRAPSRRTEDRSGGVLEAARGATATCRGALLAHAAASSCSSGPILAHADDDQPAAAAASAGRATAGRSSRCRRSTPRTPTGPAGGTPTSACIACSCRATSTSPTARSACTTRFIAASACITPRRCDGACRSASTSSSAGRRR